MLYKHLKILGLLLFFAVVVKVQGPLHHIDSGRKIASVEQVKIANSEKRPTIKKILQSLDGIEEIEDESIRNSIELKVKEKIPKMIALIDKHYPGATLAFVGRDIAYEADIFEAILDKWGNSDRVVRIDASTATFNHASGSQLVEFQKAFGISTDFLSMKRPVVFIDVVSSIHGGNQPRMLMSALWNDYYKKNGDAKIFSEKIGFIGFANGGSDGANLDKIEEVKDKVARALMNVDDSAGPEVFTGLFPMAAIEDIGSAISYNLPEWHGSFSGLTHRENGSLLSNSGPQSSLETKKKVLSIMKTIYEFTEEFDVKKTVIEEANNLGYDYNKFLINGIDKKKSQTKSAISSIEHFAKNKFPPLPEEMIEYIKSRPETEQEDIVRAVKSTLQESIQARAFMTSTGASAEQVYDLYDKFLSFQAFEIITYLLENPEDEIRLFARDMDDIYYRLVQFLSEDDFTLTNSFAVKKELLKRVLPVNISRDVAAKLVQGQISDKDKMAILRIDENKINEKGELILLDLGYQGTIPDKLSQSLEGLAIADKVKWKFIWKSETAPSYIEKWNNNAFEMYARKKGINVEQIVNGGGSASFRVSVLEHQPKWNNRAIDFDFKSRPLLITDATFTEIPNLSEQAIKVGGKYFFLSDALKDYLQSGRPVVFNIKNSELLSYLRNELKPNEVDQKSDAVFLNGAKFDSSLTSTNARFQKLELEFEHNLTRALNESYLENFTFTNDVKNFNQSFFHVLSSYGTLNLSHNNYRIAELKTVSPAEEEALTYKVLIEDLVRNGSYSDLVEFLKMKPKYTPAFVAKSIIEHAQTHGAKNVSLLTSLMKIFPNYSASELFTKEVVITIQELSHADVRVFFHLEDFVLLMEALKDDELHENQIELLRAMASSFLQSNDQKTKKFVSSIKYSTWSKLFKEDEGTLLKSNWPFFANLADNEKQLTEILDAMFQIGDIEKISDQNAIEELLLKVKFNTQLKSKLNRLIIKAGINDIRSGRSINFHKKSLSSSYILNRLSGDDEHLAYSTFRRVLLYIDASEKQNDSDKSVVYDHYFNSSLSSKEVKRRLDLLSPKEKIDLFMTIARDSSNFVNFENDYMRVVKSKANYDYFIESVLNSYNKTGSLSSIEKTLYLPFMLNSILPGKIEISKSHLQEYEKLLKLDNLISMGKDADNNLFFKKIISYNNEKLASFLNITGIKDLVYDNLLASSVVFGNQIIAPHVLSELNIDADAIYDDATKALKKLSEAQKLFLVKYPMYPFEYLELTKEAKKYDVKTFSAFFEFSSVLSDALNVTNALPGQAIKGHLQKFSLNNFDQSTFLSMLKGLEAASIKDKGIVFNSLVDVLENLNVTLDSKTSDYILDKFLTPETIQNKYFLTILGQSKSFDHLEIFLAILEKNSALVKNTNFRNKLVDVISQFTDKDLDQFIEYCYENGKSKSISELVLGILNKTSVLRERLVSEVIIPHLENYPKNIVESLRISRKLQESSSYSESITKILNHTDRPSDLSTFLYREVGSISGTKSKDIAEKFIIGFLGMNEKNLNGKIFETISNYLVSPELMSGKLYESFIFRFIEMTENKYKGKAISVTYYGHLLKLIADGSEAKMLNAKIANRIRSLAPILGPKLNNLESQYLASYAHSSEQTNPQTKPRAKALEKSSAKNIDLDSFAKYVLTKSPESGLIIETKELGILNYLGSVHENSKILVYHFQDKAGMDYVVKVGRILEKDLSKEKKRVEAYEKIGLTHAEYYIGSKNFSVRRLIEGESGEDYIKNWLNQGANMQDYKMQKLFSIVKKMIQNEVYFGDLRPANLIWNDVSDDWVIIDSGSAQFLNDKNKVKMKIQTSFGRKWFEKMLDATTAKTCMSYLEAFMKPL
ncbi:hypothetical protein M899_1769 [Bacteriovorax sp. BSW11_IV]|uniref:hypothetical protein n=1 Tax=Bacteriovorax sp. BSW11_IV TaxID=1353529 RepID=UPI000389DB73|nr:hypothetical protein [Bacteriovorax sp. BSW11_IV]EQC49351.1 hypothetical protein M899_1769 [Bacteriovorax sp. BSW11_IV]